MNHASLFSGIGGFDLAAREVGWNNVFQCEIDPFCQSVLKYYFPKTVLYEDIKRTDFTSWKGKIDVLTGGFPCQPFFFSSSTLFLASSANIASFSAFTLASYSSAHALAASAGLEKSGIRK